MGAVLLPAVVPAVHPAPRPPRPDVRHLAVDRRHPGGLLHWRGDPAGIPNHQVAGRPPRGSVVAIRVRGQARAGRTVAVPDVRGRMAVDGQPCPTWAQRGGRDRDQDAAGADPRLGRADPEVAGGGHRLHRFGRALGGCHAHHGACVMGRLPDADAPGRRSGADGAQHDAGGRAVQVGCRPGHRGRRCRSSAPSSS